MEEYFPRPLEYHPERWLRDDRAQWYSSWPRDSAYLSLPFSHGLRACPGKRFAEQGLYTAVIAVCSTLVELLHDISSTRSRFLHSKIRYDEALQSLSRGKG